MESKVKVEVEGEGVGEGNGVGEGKGEGVVVGVGEGEGGGIFNAEKQRRRVATKINIGSVCTVAMSQIRQKDLVDKKGKFPIFGASGFISTVDFYQTEKEALGIIKDGAGVGRVMRLPPYSSVIGTLMIIQPNPEIDINYLYYALTKQNLAELCSGSTIPHLYFKDFKNKLIPLPPLSDQKRIAGELDRICELKRNAEARLQKLDLLVKAKFSEMFGDPVTNPKGWKIYNHRAVAIATAL